MGGDHNDLTNCFTHTWWVVLVFLSFSKWRFVTTQDICCLYQLSIHLPFCGKPHTPSFFCFGWLSRCDCCSSHLPLRGRGMTNSRLSRFSSPRTRILRERAQVDSSWGPKGGHALAPATSSSLSPVLQRFLESITKNSPRTLIQKLNYQLRLFQIQFPPSGMLSISKYSTSFRGADQFNGFHRYLSYTW